MLTNVIKMGDYYNCGDSYLFLRETRRNKYEYLKNKRIYFVLNLIIR